MKYTQLFIFLILFFTITTVIGETSKYKLSYSLNPKLLWEEKDVEALGDVITNYTLKENKNISMSFSYFDQDLSKEIKEKSLDDMVAQLIRGKSLVYSMMGASNHKVVDKKLDKENGTSILKIQTRYEINGEVFNLVEKYYVVPNKVLLTSFRWKGNDDKYVAALKDYESTKVKVE